MNIYKVTYNSDYWVFVAALDYADAIKKMDNCQNPCEFAGVDKIEYFGKFKDKDIFVLYKEPLVYTDERVINARKDIKCECILSPDELKERSERLLKKLLEL